MTLIVQNGNLITKSGRLAQELGCCCSPCCCTGNLPPLSNLVADYSDPSSLRRIQNPATASCTGQGVSARLPKDNLGIDACDPISIVVEWCELTLTQGNGTVASLNSTGRNEPFSSFVHPIFGTLYKGTVTLAFEPLSTTSVEVPNPFKNVCGRCVFRLFLRTQVNIYPNPTPSPAFRRYFLDWRESCDEGINLMLHQVRQLFDVAVEDINTFEMPWCNEQPEITLIFAP